MKIAAPVVSKEERFTQLHRLATVAGSRVAAMFPDSVEREDMIQEALLWLMEHPGRVGRQADGDGVLYAPTLVTELMSRHLIPMARRERRARYGWRADGEGRYTPAQVRRLLPAVWTKERPQQEVSEIRPVTDPAEGNTWVTMIMDVEWGMEEALGSAREDRAILFRHYALGESWATLAASLGLSEDVLRKRASRSVLAICDVLNGVVNEDAPRPGTTLGDGPGTRRAVSNAHARAITDSSYYE